MILIHNTLSFFTWYSSPPKGPPVSASPRKYDKINNCPIFQDQWFEKSFLKHCHKNLQKKQFSLKWLLTQKLKFAHAARPFIKILYFYITIFIKGKLHTNFNLYVNRHSTIMTSPYDIRVTLFSVTYMIPLAWYWPSSWSRCFLHSHSCLPRRQFLTH